MSSTSTSTPLSDDEYAELDTLLAAPALAGAAMDVSMLEGFLTAVALSPKQITVEQWLPWVWDKAAGSAAPAQDVDNERATALAQRHHAYMVEWLAKDPDSFEPIYVCGPEWSVPAWCAGFILGTTLDKPQWAALAVSHPQYLAPFQHLAVGQRTRRRCRRSGHGWRDSFRHRHQCRLGAPAPPEKPSAKPAWRHGTARTAEDGPQRSMPLRQRQEVQEMLCRRR